jgi:hypothetical protein
MDATRMCPGNNVTSTPARRKPWCTVASNVEQRSDTGSLQETHGNIVRHAEVHDADNNLYGTRLHRVYLV